MKNRTALLSLLSICLMLACCDSVPSDTVNYCDGVECGAHGVCLQGGSGPVCLCEQGFTSSGTEPCTEANEDEPCDTLDCGTHGSCVSSIDGDVCLCETGYYAPVLGAACELVSNACEGVTCGEGVCGIVWGTNEARCICNPGYHVSGLSCMEDLDQCAGITCSGHGQCVVGANGTPLCVCDIGYQSNSTDCEASGGFPLFTAPRTELALPHPSTGWAYVPNELTVYAVQGHDEATLQSNLSSMGITITAYNPTTERYMIRFADGTTFSQFETIKTSLASLTLVASVSEVWLLEPAREPVDGWGQVIWNETTPDGANWYLETISALSAWNIKTGDSTFKVGIIDTGAISNADIQIRNTESAYDYTISDHATNVAGLMAAQGNNGIGLTGVLWNSEVYFCDHGNTNEGFLACFQWMMGLDVRVINFSAAKDYKPQSCAMHWIDGWKCGYKGTAPYPGVLDGDILAWERTMESWLGQQWLLVQAAGNEDLDAKYASVAAAIIHLDAGLSAILKDRMVVVGSIDADSSFSQFSNHGNLSLVAPGGYRPNTDAFGRIGMQVLSGGNGLSSNIGTSLAAPLVAGGAALVWSVDPEMSAAEVKSLLISAAISTVSDGNTSMVPLLNLEGAMTDVIDQRCGGILYYNFATGKCIEPIGTCIENCSGRDCGDDGCGGTCGDFHYSQCIGDTLQSCSDGQIVEANCALQNASCQPHPNAQVPGIYYCEHSTGCIDDDGDGYGVGDSCAGQDCNERDYTCWSGSCCSDYSCTDLDSDGYGAGRDCLGPDCNDSDPGLTDNCTSISFFSVDVSTDHLCTVALSGTVWCQKNNTDGKLGDGTTNHSEIPVQVIGLTNIISVNTARNHSCALSNGGSAWCWGQYGKLGDGTPFSTGTYSATPVSVALISDFVEISAGDSVSCGRRMNNTVWCWGGQFVGDGTTSTRYSPAEVLGLTNVISISAGFSSRCAVRSDGTVWCWGSNDLGQLGNGTIGGSANSPVQVQGVSTATEVTVGGYENDIYNNYHSRHACAVLSGGIVTCWGSNYWGQLGDGTTTNTGFPVLVQGMSDAIDVSAGARHTCALKSDGTVWCWGYNGSGQLGDGSSVQSLSPVMATVPTDQVLKLVAHGGHTCAEQANHSSVVCWGTGWGY